MRKVVVITILILLIPLCMASFVEGVDTGYVPAQGNPQETGELLPDSNLLLEPDVEIGDSSPEFSYDHELQGDTGAVSLIWVHSSSHYMDYSYVPYAGYPQCDEFARMKQEFTWEYNQTPVTLSISASVQITCTGDFETHENADVMYAIWFWMGVPGGSYAVRIKTIGGLKGGQNYDLQFLLPNLLAEQIFAGSVSEGGLQMYPHDNYTLYMGLIPSIQFTDYYGGMDQWSEFEGSVTATITHFSMKALLDVENLTPSLISPRFNTTSLWNQTYSGIGLEPMGQSSFLHFDFDSWSGEFVLGKMTSDHNSIWNVTPLGESSGYLGIPIVDVVDNNVYLLSNNISADTVGLLLMKLDAQGQELWNTTITLSGYDLPALLDVTPSGTIYLLSLSLNYGEPQTIENMVITYRLACLDSLGDILWNKTLLNLTYEEYVLSFYTSGFSVGLCSYGDGIFVGMPPTLLRYDSSGNELWNISHDFVAFCPDQFGGFYTCERMPNGDFQISKWGTEGSIRWSRSINLDYGLGWRDFPMVGRMEVGPDQLLYVELEYRNINHVITITRISRTGQIHSQDTIFDLQDTESYGTSYRRPHISDIAVTGDGLVHLMVFNESVYSEDPPYGLFYPYSANILLTYELSGPVIFTMGPESMIISGVATLILGGIAWDHFIRGRTRPEEILPEQEEIDPWEILMGDTEDG